MSQTELSEALRDWYKFHRHIFDWACFNAYELKHHPERCPTHVFEVKLRRTGRSTAGSARKSKKLFKIAEASLVTRASFVNDPDNYYLSTRLVASDAEMAARVGETRPKAHLMLTCASLGLSFSGGGYWDAEELAERSESKNWKSILKSVTDGKKEYDMVNGNPVRRR